MRAIKLDSFKGGSCPRIDVSVVYEAYISTGQLIYEMIHSLMMLAEMKYNKTKLIHGFRIFFSLLFCW